MQYFGSSIVEGVAESWVEAEMSWLEVEMSWVEVGGGGWNWVEVGARFRNAHKKYKQNLHLDVSFFLAIFLYCPMSWF